ncbi:MAG: hypothetical protein ACFE0R_17790 [Salinarimonas sp.]
MTQTHLGYVNVVEPREHGGVLNFDVAERFSEDFAKPTVFRGLAPISERLSRRAFFEEIDPEMMLQWRVKTGDEAVSMRSEDGRSDYNYVTGRVGTGREFLDDLFEHERDVYSHLGTISSGYADPYPWGKEAFALVKREVFGAGWFRIEDWEITGHMFMGRSNQDYGEPARGAVGSDWHVFPTLNVFVMIAGTKKWMTRPPAPGDQYRHYDLMFETSSGREAPGGDFESDVFHLEPGDVLLNPPFEWHKVLNARGYSLGAAFRVIDRAYLARLAERRNLDIRKIDRDGDARPGTEELAHFLTSISYASRHPQRAQMILNDLEYAYLRKGRTDAVHIGHQ